MYVHLYYMFLKFLYFIYFKISLLHIYIYIQNHKLTVSLLYNRVCVRLRPEPDRLLFKGPYERHQGKTVFLHTRNQRCRSALRYPLTQIVQSFFFINLKLQASRHILQLYSPVCVGPGQKPRRPVFSQRGSYCRGHFLQHVASLFHFAQVPKIMKK